MSPEGPATKRRRIERNPYLDLEAGDNGPNEDDENEEEAAPFLADTDEEEDLEEQGQPQIQLRREEPQNYANIADAIAERYVHRQPRMRGPIEEDRSPMPGEVLYAFFCRKRYELETIAHLFTRSEMQDARMVGIQSMFFNPSLPGKIFVEAESACNALHAVDALPYVFRQQPVVLTADEMKEALRCWAISLNSSDTEVFSPQSWIRLRKGNSVGPEYVGDIALITDVTDTYLEIVLQPRVVYNQERPVEKDLFNVLLARDVAGPDSVVDLGGSWQFKGRTYTLDGYLCFPSLKPKHAESVNAPSAAELSTFIDCRSITKSTVALARSQAETASIRIGDRVKVAEGSEYIGRVGKVLVCDENEVEIFLERIRSRINFADLDPEEVVQMPIRSVKKVFFAGDCVIINEGEDEDKIGWVIKILEEQVQVFVKGEDSQKFVTLDRSNINHDQGQLNFHRLEMESSDLTSAERRQMRENPYQVVIGSQVMIIGNHEYKGRQGLVKDISLQGRAKVELKVVPIRYADIDVDHWMIMDELLKRKSQSWREVNPAALIFPVDNPTVMAMATPLPSAEDLACREGVWDPNEGSSCCEEVTSLLGEPVAEYIDISWMSGTWNISECRLKLKEEGNARTLQLISVEGDTAVVRDQGTKRSIPVKKLTPARPGVDELAMALRGNHVGNKFKVRSIDHGVCEVRPASMIGKRLRKGEKFPRISIDDLIATFPPIK